MPAILKAHLTRIYSHETPEVLSCPQALLNKKYQDMDNDYLQVKKVNDLVYNESTLLVSVFKDYLIKDDINEFLRRPYTMQESLNKLQK